MRARIVSTLGVFALIFCGAVGAAARQAAPANTAVSQLKQEIERLEAVERDPSTAPEVRELNRGFLQERRRRLQALLQVRVKALRDYAAAVRSTLTAEEMQGIENSIREMERDLAPAGAGPAAESAAAKGNGSPAPAAQRQRVTEAVSDSSGVAGDAGAPATNAVSDRAADAPPAAAAEAAPAAAPVPAPGGAGLTSPSPVPAQEFPDPQSCDEYAKNPRSFSLYERYVCNLITEAVRNKGAGNQPIELSGEQFTDLAVILVAQKLRSTFVLDAEEARVDKQVESSASGAGSTSLVIKGGTPAVLGFAVANGALEREVSGTTITFRGNPVGLVETLADQGFLTGYEDDSPTTRFLRKTSFAFSFDTDRGREPGVFTGDRQQLSALSARIELLNRRDPRGRAYRTDWEHFLATRAQAFTAVSSLSEDALLESVPISPGSPVLQLRWKDAALQTWFEETQAALGRALPADVEAVLKERLASLPITELSQGSVDALNNYARALNALVEGRQRILDRVARGTILTFEYTNDREVSAPDTSNFRGIYETSFGGMADLTLNGSVTLFGRRPPGTATDRLRDFQFAGQLDFPFGNPTGAGRFVLSVAGKYERLMEDASTQLGLVVPDTSGDIGLFQVKLVVPIKGLGMKLPISATFANRTELVKEREVRGNFGFTFDLDSILARFKPF